MRRRSVRAFVLFALLYIASFTVLRIELDDVANAALAIAALKTTSVKWLVVFLVDALVGNGGPEIIE